MQPQKNGKLDKSEIVMGEYFHKMMEVHLKTIPIVYLQSVVFFQDIVNEIDSLRYYSYMVLVQVGKTN
jgi:GH35 family endo-1,4-beta-xylanase